MKTFLKILFPVIILASTAFAGELSLTDLMRERHSGRSYDPAKTISLEQMHLLAEAASLAPSSHNEQPWHFLMCDRILTPDAYDKVFSCLKPSNQIWVRNAPTIIIVSAKTLYSKNDKPNPFHLYDTGSAGISMALKAVELGLMAHQVGGFDPEKVQQAFNIPEGFKPITIMIVGYELQPSDEFPNPPKVRKPLQENFFLGSWGASL
jgi:nitroreductase